MTVATRFSKSRRNRTASAEFSMNSAFANTSYTTYIVSRGGSEGKDPDSAGDSEGKDSGFISLAHCGCVSGCYNPFRADANFVQTSSSFPKFESHQAALSSL